MIRFRNAATSFIAGLIYGVFDRQRELSSALIIMFAGIIVVSIGGVSGFGVGAEILSMAALFVSIFSAVDFLISTKTRNRIRDKILEIYVRSDDAVKTADRLAVDRERKRFESIKTLSIVSLYMRDKGRRSAIAYVVMFTVICWEAFFVRNPSYWVVFGCVIFGAALAFDNYLLSYRIRQGYYANNEIEARELITYILNNIEKFDAGDGNLRIFDPIESEMEIAAKVAPLGQEA